MWLWLQPSLQEMGFSPGKLQRKLLLAHIVMTAVSLTKHGVTM